MPATEPSAPEQSHQTASGSTENPGTQPSDRRWMILVTGITLLITILPYLIGASLSAGRHFMWLGYNIDDSNVYLSWMRQAADGSTRALNLFTTDSQNGMLLNPLFLLLGWVARLTGLPLIAVFHLSRLAFAGVLLTLVWWLLHVTVLHREAQRLAYLCVCFASGIGWLPLPWASISPAGLPPGPVDTWQPEAITFLSLYLSPLFCFSLALQVAIIGLLFQGERTGKAGYAVAAGIGGCCLGLTHTYDVISLTAVWITYLLFGGFYTFDPTVPQDRGIHAPSHYTTPGSILRAIIAGTLTLPSVLYIYHTLQTEATFNKRMNVVTASTSIPMLLLGYGLTLLLAIYAFHQATRSMTAAEVVPEGTITNHLKTWFASGSALRLFGCWALANFLVSYLPVSRFPFQRKMLQGEHFPIAILAGVGLAYLLTHPALKAQRTNHNLVTLLILLILALSNLQFIANDLTGFRQNTIHQQRPYLNEGELEALDWLAKNTTPETAVQPLPWVAKIDEHHLGVVDMSLGCIVPGMIHRHVYCGHWGETPDYPAKIQEFITFMKPNTDDNVRKDLLRTMKVKYLIFSQKELQDGTLNPFHPYLSDPVMVPNYLTLVHSNHDADVYRIDL